MKLKELVIKGVLWNFSDKIFNQFGTFLVTIYLSRILTPGDFGLVGLLTVFIAISNIVIDGGFYQALVQKSHHLKDIETSTVFWSNLSISFFLYIFLFFISPYLAVFFKEPELSSTARVLFVVIIINSYSIAAKAKLAILVDFKSQAIANISGTFVGSIVAIIAANNGLGFWSIVLLALVKSFITTIVMCRLSFWKPKMEFSIIAFRELFKFGSNLMISGLVATLVSNLYLVVIAKYFNTDQAGYFIQASNITNALSGILSSVIQGVSYPILTSLNNQPSRMILIYKKLIEVTALFSFPVMFGFAVVAEDFTQIFLGEKWAPIVPLLSFMAFARIVTPISSINMNILNAVGRSDLFLLIDISKLPLTLSVLFFVLPYGIKAVAGAMIFTSFIAFFINSYFPGKMFSFGPIKQIELFLKYILSSVVMIAVVNIVNLEFEIILFFMKIFTGFFIYTSMLLLFKEKYIISVIRKVKKYI
ncbi:MAG: lipopolysaccharide biosynthesis protein [Candidatus Electrothrix aestuarii]|uniref:Lipopolysaccharide biosynthesis protein n=1 Tax=Candidatus Electrothrix aestuarii TaxID=3062594 RepID=A0AAU8LSG3_9BACT|nr:lipopolysaccharide biosynthesis protein [Candidatus Electrothrix aestuarii]